MQSVEIGKTLLNRSIFHQHYLTIGEKGFCLEKKYAFGFLGKVWRWIKESLGLTKTSFAVNEVARKVETYVADIIVNSELPPEKKLKQLNTSLQNCRLFNEKVIKKRNGHAGFFCQKIEKTPLGLFLRANAKQEQLLRTLTKELAEEAMIPSATGTFQEIKPAVKKMMRLIDISSHGFLEDLDKNTTTQFILAVQQFSEVVLQRVFNETAQLQKGVTSASIGEPRALLDYLYNLSWDESGLKALLSKPVLERFHAFKATLEEVHGWCEEGDRSLRNSAASIKLRMSAISSGELLQWKSPYEGVSLNYALLNHSYLDPALQSDIRGNLVAGEQFFPKFERLFRSWEKLKPFIDHSFEEISAGLEVILKDPVIFHPAFGRLNSQVEEIYKACRLLKQAFKLFVLVRTGDFSESAIELEGCLKKLGELGVSWKAGEAEFDALCKQRAAVVAFEHVYCMRNNKEIPAAPFRAIDFMKRVEGYLSTLNKGESFGREHVVTQDMETLKAMLERETIPFLTREALRLVIESQRLQCNPRTAKCPISYESFNEPKLKIARVKNEPHYFSSTAIRAWLVAHDKNPISGKLLSIKDLEDGGQVKGLMDNFADWKDDMLRSGFRVEQDASFVL